jgi:hypothetical protein
MDNRPDENGLVINHIPKSGFLKTDLDPVMSLGLLIGYFAHPYECTGFKTSLI